MFSARITEIERSLQLYKGRKARSLSSAIRKLHCDIDGLEQSQDKLPLLQGQRQPPIHQKVRYRDPLPKAEARDEQRLRRFGEVVFHMIEKCSGIENLQLKEGWRWLKDRVVRFKRQQDLEQQTLRTLLQMTGCSTQSELVARVEFLLNAQ